MANQTTDKAEMQKQAQADAAAKQAEDQDEADTDAADEKAAEDPRSDLQKATDPPSVAPGTVTTVGTRFPPTNGVYNVGDEEIERQVRMGSTSDPKQAEKARKADKQAQMERAGLK
jgi:hypothetical protein